MRLQRVGHDWVTKTHTHIHIWEIEEEQRAEGGGEGRGGDGGKEKRAKGRGRKKGNATECLKEYSVMLIECTFSVFTSIREGICALTLIIICIKHSSQFLLTIGIKLGCVSMLHFPNYL